MEPRCWRTEAPRAVHDTLDKRRITYQNHIYCIMYAPFCQYFFKFFNKRECIFYGKKGHEASQRRRNRH